ncbi:hypothetical protein DCAR_0934688 [Daucus carota subsp. sativus]|uniref:Uncharacterized protein n=1 Tax=Daucus carota subsp. sativus TaxID=79200 RepID=A0AAF0XZ82_DAUCS|nr:hypothetical protein DCAR_0934688 [Daucus carota subsp. sativus]
MLLHGIMGRMWLHIGLKRLANRGLRSLVVAYQEVPEGGKESAGGQFIGLY